MNKDPLLVRMQKLGITPDSLEEKFVIGSGPGGQNLQKTASCVWLKHLPSGVEVKCQQSRSREENRTIAREQLCALLEKKRKLREQEQKAAQAKKRRQTRQRSKAQKEKLVEQKRHTSKKKALRKVRFNSSE